jgi:hypothetical protein
MVLFRRKDNQYILPENLSDIQIPDTIQDHRCPMDRLEENFKKIMQVASV